MSSRLDYLRDGGAIYARSFAMIRAEADLSRFHGTAERVVERMIHACGMTDLPRDVEASEDFAAAALRLLGDDAAWRAMHHACLARGPGPGWDAIAARFEALA